MSVAAHSDGIEIRESPIHGFGIFSRSFVAAGRAISRIAGRRITAGDHPNCIGVGPGEWIDPLPPFAWLNHSCQPSCAVRGAGVLVARRFIRAGEELTIDYSTTEADPAWSMPCTCGSRGCRGVLRAAQFAFDEVPDGPDGIVAFWRHERGL